LEGESGFKVTTFFMDLGTLVVDREDDLAVLEFGGQAFGLLEFLQGAGLVALLAEHFAQGDVYVADLQQVLFLVAQQFSQPKLGVECCRVELFGL